MAATDDIFSLEKSNPDFRITFDDNRETFYENDTIKGNLEYVELKKRTPVHKLRVVVICEISYKDSLGLLWKGRLHCQAANMATKEDCLEQKSTGRIAFSIAVPGDLPSSIAVERPETRGTTHRAVYWSVRIVAENARGHASILASRAFYKGALYRLCLPPKSETVRHELVHSSRALTLLAELDKNVYVHDEPLHVRLKIENELSAEVNEITLKAFQKMNFCNPSRETVSFKRQKIAQFNTSEHCPIAKGKAQLDLYITPGAESRSRFLCLRSKPEGCRQDDRPVLAPSIAYYDTRCNRPESIKITICVQYTLKIELSLSLGRKVSVTLPFTLADPIENAVGIEPRAHRLPTYVAKTSKSFLQKSVVDAIIEYGREESLLEAELRRKRDQLAAEQAQGISAVAGKVGNIVNKNTWARLNMWSLTPNASIDLSSLDQVQTLSLQNTDTGLSDDGSIVRLELKDDEMPLDREGGETGAEDRLSTSSEQSETFYNCSPPNQRGDDGATGLKELSSTASECLSVSRTGAPLPETESSYPRGPHAIQHKALTVANRA